MGRITEQLQVYLAREIADAGGREVSFVVELDQEGQLVAGRAVARGTVDCVLALPGIADSGEMLLHNHPSGLLEPSAADLNVAARFHDGGIGFGIINNEATDLYVVVEVPRVRSYQKLDPIRVGEMLGATGAVAGALQAYEDRPSQRDMGSYVADVYNDGGIALLEAGTGVGKSFAYLVPALLWARYNDERTVVSTNTINLQEQLIGKDLPALSAALNDGERAPTFAMLKGWRNYLCLARLQVARAGQGSLLEPDRQAEMDSLYEWSQRTRDGSLADLAEPPSGDVWDEVSAEADLCPRVKCRFFNDCFLFEARRRAAEADVIVVNHHLLAADVAIRRASDNWQDAAVLPPYKRLILDEAHHLEDTASQHLGARVTSTGVSRLFSRLERKGKGLIPTLIVELAERDDDAARESLVLVREKVLASLADARMYSERVFAHIVSLFGDSDVQLRLEDSFASHPIWARGLGVDLDNFISVLNRLKNVIEEVADRMELEDPEERGFQLIQELRAVVRRCESLVDGLTLSLRPRNTVGLVRWVERRGSRPQGPLQFPVGISAVPLDVAAVLRDTLFQRVDTVVLTSATLSTSGSFDFVKERTGLSLVPDRLRYEEILPSPFDFPSQSVLAVPTDLPDPRRDETGHSRRLVQVVLETAGYSDGGMFVLFTSHAALRRAAGALRSSGECRWPLLVQGEGNRDKLLQRFRESQEAILLGTDSFWEGVDVPGSALRALVLAKLPFKSPTEPITAARLEFLRENGEDGFSRYQVPHAALKLKQGFGRLIRTKADYGVVILLDSRAVTARYGAVMLEGLPPAARITGPWEDLRGSLEEFYSRFRDTD